MLRTIPHTFKRSVATASSSTVDVASQLSNIRAGIILSRIPIVTPEPTPFENAYYKYQDELERRLMWTFPQYYYYKKGSLSERKFVSRQKYPITKQPGVIFEKGDPDVRMNRERRLKQEIVVPKEESEDGNDALTKRIEPNSRITEADKKNDTTSLIRKLDRTLYLMVKDSNGGWKLPSFKVNESEPLHDAAERGLRDIGGVNMHTWTVSNSPCVYYNSNNNNNLKEFYIKSHIIHGQFKPQDKDTNEFAWLTKEEVCDKVDVDYFNKIGPVLSHV